MTPPNPGSEEARKKGCLCPILDNAHGRGHMGVPDRFVWRDDCPLHGTKAQAERERVATEMARIEAECGSDR